MFIASFRSGLRRIAASLGIILLAGSLSGQVALSSGTYTQTFDGLGGGLPAGWTVHTGATATALGTAVSPATAAVSWANTGGQWQNSASATGLVGNEAVAVQAAATNRALAIRQSGSFGDPGAAASFNFSTTGLQVTAISFSAQMLSVQTRSTTWQLQYGLGAAPAAWTTIGTYTDPGAFGSTTVTAAGFGTALDNQANVRLRIVTLAASSGSGSRDTFGMDDFTIVTTTGSGPVPPAIATPPAAQTVTEGGNAQFTVVANGTAPLSYQWRKNTTPLADGVVVTGALTATLSLSGVALADAGSYDVVVTNAAGSVTSPAATLTVNPALQPPAITTPPSSQSAALGGSATFTVVATGTAPLSYQWRRAGVPLADGGNITGAQDATLTISPVGASDVGSYDVVVSNAASTTATSTPATLSLAALVTPTGQVAYAGGAYVQNFDTLPAAGTFTLTGTGPIALEAAPINATGLGGWSLAKYGGTGPVALFRVDAGTSTSGGVDSYGTAGSSDRALGSLSSGSTIPRFGVVLTNGTGRTITEFTLSYTGEQWRRGTAAANSLAFEYGLGATDINSGTFMAAPTLNFTAPVTLGSGTALDGNAAANRVPVSATVTGLSWAPGQTLVLRWTDVDDTGGDDGLAVDDLTFSTPVAPGDILPAVVYTTPADGAVNIPAGGALAVTFNEAVNFAATGFTLSGSASGEHPATLSGGPVSYTLTPATPFGEGEVVTLTIAAAQLSDAATGTQHPATDFTASYITFSSAPLPIHTVQGAGLASAYAGHPVTLQGVVVASFQAPGQIGGYYLEAPDAEHDADPATSEGIYLFDNTNSVTVGDLVTVTGTVTEYLSSSAPATMTQTELSGVTAFTKVSSGNPLPTPAAVTLPFVGATAAERYEGMLVTLPQTLTVTDNYDLGHFGEVVLSNGRLPQPTNIVAPGAAAQAQEVLNQRNQIMLDDGLSQTYPSPTPYLNSADPAVATRRAGSTATGVTGVLDTKFGLYVVEPTAAPVFTEANPRLAAPASLGSLRVVFGNVENYMNGDGAGGGFPTSRGASTYAEFQLQTAKVTAAILNLAPDIMGLSEVENDRITNGAPHSYGPTSAIAQLVASLNAQAPAGTTYAFVDASAVDIVTDLIHSAIIYRVETVEPAGAAAMLDNVYYNNHARNPLAQTFRQKATGGRLTVCVNHFRAKAGASSLTDGIAPNPNNDQGDGQGTNNYLRTKEAQALTAWLATDPTGSGDPRVLILGDLNAYAKEDPIAALTGAGYVNLAERFEGAEGYSYAFNGAFGHLDHALATPSLNAEVLSLATWHANSDEPVYYDYNVEDKDAAQVVINAGTPYRYADHDPVVVGLELTAAPAITVPPAAQTVIVGTPVTFTVAATGNPAPTYQWRRNGAPIAGAQADSLTLPSPVTADSGTYDVVVANSVGSVTSEPAVLTVNKAPAAIALGGLTQTYDGTPRVVTAGTTPAGLAVQLTYAGNATAPTSAGTYAVVATIADANYFGTATGTLTVAPASASLGLGHLSQVYDGSGKSATVTTTPAGIATVVTYDGATALPVNAGSYAVSASLNDPNYTGAPATGTLTITKAAATVTLGGLAQAYDGTPRTVSAVTAPAGLPVQLTYNGSAAAPVNAGSYAVVATVNAANYTGTATGTLVVSPAAATVTLGGLYQLYDGAPKPVTVTTVPANLSVTLTYNGSATAPTNPGSYTVVATVNEANYTGTVTGTLLIEVTALVRRLGALNGGIHGSVQVATADAVTLNGGAWISGNLLVPGTPTVRLNGHPAYAGTNDGTGAVAPAGYTITLNGNSVLQHVVRRTDPPALPVVPVPPAPAGTRSVSLNTVGQSPGDFATLRNLTLNGNVGQVAVPAGSYGTFIVNGNSALVLGLAGATAPAVYNLQSLTLNGTSRLLVVGPVILNLANGVTLNGSMGSAEHPEWLELNLAAGGLTLNGNVIFDGYVTAPAGTVTINGGCALNGGVVADRLTINGNGALVEVDD